MSADTWGEIIRTERDAFKTPNLYRVVEPDSVEVVNQYFRENKLDQELFLFFAFEGELWFPIWFEFRSINNNLLFLFEEFEIESFGLLQRILNSSLKKEEGFTTEMKAIVFHTKAKPAHCYCLEKFVIEDEYRIDLFER